MYVLRTDISLSRLTYNATLAELTSLEEMMRILMDEGHIHQDLISKLWTVFSQSAPSYHRLHKLTDCLDRF